MTIQEAHKLNAGTTIHVKKAHLKKFDIETKVESVSISETGPIIWFYNLEGKLVSTECHNVEVINLVSEDDRVNKFLAFLNERIDTASSEQTKTSYIIVREQFTRFFKWINKKLL